MSRTSTHALQIADTYTGQRGMTGSRERASHHAARMNDASNAIETHAYANPAYIDHRVTAAPAIVSTAASHACHSASRRPRIAVPREGSGWVAARSASTAITASSATLTATDATVRS